MCCSHEDYVVRASLSDTSAVEATGRLSTVERAFHVGGSRPRVRPVRVRGRVFLCIPGWYAGWRMRRRFAPLLFEDRERQAARRQRTAPVEMAQTGVTLDSPAFTPSSTIWPASSSTSSAGKERTTIVMRQNSALELLKGIVPITIALPIGTLSAANSARPQP